MSSVKTCNLCDGDRITIEEFRLYCMECAGEQSAYCSRCDGCGCVRRTVAQCLMCGVMEVREEAMIEKNKADWS